MPRKLPEPFAAGVFIWDGERVLCVSRGWRKRPRQYAATVAAAKKEANRTPRKRQGPRHWDWGLPAGHPKDGHETPEGTARREFYEETGYWAPHLTLALVVPPEPLGVQGVTKEFFVFVPASPITGIKRDSPEGKAQFVTPLSMISHRCAMRESNRFILYQLLGFVEPT